MASGVVPPTFERCDERGTFVEVVNRGPWETVLTGQMHAGAVLGHHYHKLTDMFFFLASGNCRMDTVQVKTGERRQVALTTGQGACLPRYHSHAIRFDAESTFILLKSRAYDPEDPDTYEHPVPEAAPCDVQTIAETKVT